MKFNTYFKNAKGRWQYKGNIDLKLKENTYECLIYGNTNPTDKKFRAWLESASDKSKQKTINDKDILKQLNRQLYKLFIGIDISIKKIEDKVKIIKTKKINSFEEILNNFSDSERLKLSEFEVNDSFTLIDKYITDHDIEVLSKLQAGENKLVISSTLGRLDKLLMELELLMRDNSTYESKYQNLLLSFCDMFPIIFGFHGQCQKEECHKEGSINKFDIEGEDWIIELKRPVTRLFASQGSRGNISGISSAFVSADNQLSLYVKKKNRERDLVNSFTKAILLIGNNDMIDSKEKILALEMMREKSSIKILTFTDVKNLIERNILFYKK